MPTLHNLLKTHFGYTQFRPLQEEIIAEVLANRDVLALMPTGGGKSLCYQLPALMLPGVTLVVSPLIALMKDQVDALKVNGVAAESIHSGLPAGAIAAVEGRVRKGEVKLLYISPERLALPSFQRLLDKIPVSLLAIDEAHCISEWGHDFRPDYRNLKALRERYSRVPVIALTATATERVRRDIIDQLGLEEARLFLSSFNRPNLSYRVKPKSGAMAALKGLLVECQGEPAIVYCCSRKDAEALSTNLTKEGIKALPYHAGLAPEIRQANQERFIRDEVSVIVATIAFGMGINKPDVRLVVHYDLPKSLEGYYQETGRAGRDGLPSRCVLFYSYGDSIKQSFFIEQIVDPAEHSQAKEKLRQMLDFCQLRSCRRAHLMRYFGEEWPEDDCDACDNCLEPQELMEATEIAKKILSAVLRTGERFGVGVLAGVLRGSEAVKKKYPWLEKLSVFGIVQDFSEVELKDLASSLVGVGFLARSEGEYPTMVVSGEGKRFLKSDIALSLPRPRAAVGKLRSKKEKVVIPAVTDYDQALFERLRVLRRRLASELAVAPFMVFSDATLRQMAAMRPRDLQAFADISGVGEKKLAQFGAAFVAIINVAGDSY